MATITKQIGTTGNDQLFGTTGRDNLWGGDGNDELDGGADRDVLHGGPGNDELKGGDGHDVLYGGTGRDKLYGEDGNDVLVGQGQLDGGPGNDTILAGPGSHVYGGPGADILMASGWWSAVRYRGDLLPDGRGMGVTVNLATGTGQGADAEGDVISGSWFRVIGSPYDDTLTGDEKDNWLRGKDGGDTLDGGDGEDWAAYTGSPQGVQVDLGGPKVNSFVSGTGGYAEGDKLKNIERLWGSEHDDTLRGDGVRNHLIGGDGDDVLEGRGGSDGITGGSGSDTASYEHSPGGVTVDLTHARQAGTETTNYDAAGDGFHSIENLRGSAHADTLTGDSGDNILEGGGGGDTLDGGDGHDTASYESSSGSESGEGVTVNLGGSRDANDYVIGHTGGHAAGDKLKNIENLRGSAGKDTLTGDSGDNVLEGGADADTLDGGGTGDSDTASYAHSAGGVTVNLTLGTQALENSDATGDRLTNIENLRGSAHADTLTGDSGDNVLEGGAGKDKLTGGAGADTFVFGAESVVDSDGDLNAKTDTVGDFSQSEGDKLDFRGLKDHASLTGTKLIFRGMDAFSNSADQGQVRYQYIPDKDATNVQVDLNGDGEADFQVTLDEGDMDENYTLTVSDMLGVEVA